MNAPPPDLPIADATLAEALVASSREPLLLLADDLTITGASVSFCEAFGIDPRTVAGTSLSALGNGEWDVPQLDSLLRATFAGNAAIDAYEMDLKREGHPLACLLLSAHKLNYGRDQPARVMLAVTDATAARQVDRDKDDLVQKNQVLLQELQHRVANSLQIIASVLMQSARKVQSAETRFHLHDAHNRVMSIATLQKQLAIKSSDGVALGQYLADLCRSIGASMIDDAKRITLTSHADDTVLDPNVSVSLGLIVTELVINALKHAFPGRNQKGRIEVSYASDAAGWTLIVADDGSGMKVEAEAKPGLGTGIVQALARQLKATVETAENSPGTRVTVAHRNKAD